MTEFAEKLRTLQFRAKPAPPKRTVDHHDHHKVVVTERTDRDGDHQDVNIFAPTIKVKTTTTTEG